MPPCLGVVKRMATAEMFRKVKEFVTIQEQLGYRWVHVHASTPCSSGSPVKNFSASQLNLLFSRKCSLSGNNENKNGGSLHSERTPIPISCRNSFVEIFGYNSNTDSGFTLVCFFFNASTLVCPIRHHIFLNWQFLLLYLQNSNPHPIACYVRTFVSHSKRRYGNIHFRAYGEHVLWLTVNLPCGPSFGVDNSLGVNSWKWCRMV